MATLDVVLDDGDLLGEGPWWSVRERRLWRVDILAHTLHAWDPTTSASQRWTFEENVGFAVPSRTGSVCLGLRSGIAEADLESGGQRLIVSTPGTGAGRFNDGKTDRRGRVWAGTIVDDQRVRDGAFGMLGDGGFVVHVDEVGISNGLGWSPDDETMYLTDSSIRTIWAFDFDIETAELSNRRIFAEDEDCEPDGLTVDSEGGVWSAKWDGGRIVRYDPDGTISQVIDAPVSRPTSCAFGGPDLDTLFVTSASVGLDDDECAATPAGAVLAVQPGVRGLPEAEAVVGDAM